MNIYKKVIWIAVVLVVFISIAVTNMMDRDRFTTIKDTVTTIYEDRLIAKNIIVELSHLMYEKELASATSDAAFFGSRNEQVNTNINELIAQFETTKLTASEERIFAELQSKYESLQKLENERSLTTMDDRTVYNAQIDKVQKSLNDLSAIQLEEGKRQLNISKKAVEEIELFTKAENIMFVLLALLLVGVIFIVPSDKVNEK